MTRAAALLATLARSVGHSRTDTDRRRELDPGFVENFPFFVLLDSAWRPAHVSEPHTRCRRVGPVHTVAFTHSDGHTAIFDIDRYGQMSDRATYTLDHPDQTAAMFFAYTAGAAAAITVDPHRPVDDLATIPGVRRIG